MGLTKRGKYAGSNSGARTGQKKRELNKYPRSSGLLSAPDCGVTSCFTPLPAMWALTQNCESLLLGAALVQDVITASGNETRETSPRPRLSHTKLGHAQNDSTLGWPVGSVGKGARCRGQTS